MKWTCNSHSFAVLATAAIFVVVLAVGTGCNSPGEGSDDARAGEVVIDLEKRDNRRLLAYYVGGMVGLEAADPFEAGFLREDGDKFFLRVDSIAEAFPVLSNDLRTISEDGLINWPEFETLVLTHYYSYRSLPGTVELLTAESGDWVNNAAWFRVRVNGVMSPHLRQINIRLENLYAAIGSYFENEERLIYPVGTIFISEHLDGETRVELSVMKKRHDGFWDFFAYDENNTLTSTLKRNPNDLDVPTKCIGCHFGSRLFEPERSFPSDPQPGPDGPRALYFDHPVPDRQIISDLDEHRKRSDLILGLYGTLVLGKLKGLERDGSLSPEEAAILRKMGI